MTVTVVLLGKLHKSLLPSNKINTGETSNLIWNWNLLRKWFVFSSNPIINTVCGVLHAQHILTRLVNSVHWILKNIVHLLYVLFNASLFVGYWAHGNWTYLSGTGYWVLLGGNIQSNKISNTINTIFEIQSICWNKFPTVEKNYQSLQN